MINGVSAFLVYGMVLDSALLDEGELDLQDHPGVSALRAGVPGRGKLYLAANVQKADLGIPRFVSVRRSRDTYGTWDRRLRNAAMELGAEDWDVPAWILVADAF